jgi:hypothetical protein
LPTSIDTRHTDFSEMDNAGISKEHWKIMLISGIGFFTDAYDLGDLLGGGSSMRGFWALCSGN